MRLTRRHGSIHDRPELDLRAIAQRADDLMGIARRMQVQNSERDHGAKDEIIRGLAAIKRQLEPR